MDVRLSKSAWSSVELWQAKRLFLTAFPPEERPPFRVMRQRARYGVDWWKVLADGKFAGFLYVLRDAELAYIFHFAILRECRGRGVGTAAIRELMRIYEGKKLFLAMEPVDSDAPNLAERVARRSFYLRCGMREMGQRVQEGDVIYELLGAGGQVTNEEYQALIRQWMPPQFAGWVRMEILD